MSVSCTSDATLDAYVSKPIDTRAFPGLIRGLLAS